MINFLTRLAAIFSATSDPHHNRLKLISSNILRLPFIIKITCFIFFYYYYCNFMHWKYTKAKNNDVFLTAHAKIIIVAFF